MSGPQTHVPTEPYSRPFLDGPDVLRLDGNEGNRPSAELLDHLASLDPAVLRNYPDVAELQAEIAAHWEIDYARVVITAGADDALDRLCRAYLGTGRQLVLPVPAFEMLYRFVEIAGGDLVTVPWRGAFPVEEVIASVGPATALIGIVSPNNPTGETATAGDVERVAVAASNALIVLDHVYVEYSDQDLTRVALQHDNVVVLRTFSKAWGLAGCRVGFAVATLVRSWSEYST